MSETVLPPRYVSVEEECRRNPELKMSDLHILKDWMDKQPHLPKIELFLLVLFLHSNYYRIEPTKKMIENYFTIKTHVPEIFSNRDSIACKELRKIFSIYASMQLQQKTKEGYTMIFTILLDPDPSKYDFFETVKYLFMIIDLEIIMNGTSQGMILIFDVSGMSFGHLVRIPLMGLKRMLHYIQDCMPVRLKGIEVLNTVPAIDTIISMIKPFAKVELLNLLHTHSSLETVKDLIPIEALPNESGGKAGPIKELTAQTMKLLDEFHEWFKYEEHNARVNESLRVGGCQTAESLFGVDGSFRKLDID